MSAENLRCSVCNNQILPDFKFCPSCGATNPYYRPPELAPPIQDEAPSAEQEMPFTQPPETAAYSYPAYEASPPVDDQAAGVSGSPGPLDFASLFGYGMTEEATKPQAQELSQETTIAPEAGLQQIASASEPTEPAAYTVEQAPPQTETISEPEVGLASMEGTTAAEAEEPENIPLLAAIVESLPPGTDASSGTDTAPTQVAERKSPSTGPLPELAAAEANDVPEAVASTFSAGDTQLQEAGYKPGPATGPLGQDAPVVVETGAADEAEERSQEDEKSAEDEAAGDMQPQPMQDAPDGQQEEDAALSFSDLFSWSATDESKPGASEPAASGEQGAYTTPVPSWQEDANAGTPAQPSPQESTGEPATTVFTYDSAATQQTSPQYDAPSWRPDDEEQSSYRPVDGAPTTEQQSQQSAWTQPPTPTPSVYQSYSPGASTPSPVTTPDIPLSGQRPKPGTPEYEEMARKALEAKGISPTPPQGYTPRPGVTDTPATSSTPSTSSGTAPVLPPGQRPKPGTPEYEEMARRAMEERLKQQGGAGAATSQPTPSQGYTPQAGEASYPPPTPPVTPTVPPPGQRPKPGTPEYEEMARRALEERLRQQGK
jgi:hypothetical protein